MEQDKKEFKVEIMYENKEATWNTLICYIISFIIDSNSIKEALEKIDGEHN